MSCRVRGPHARSASLGRLIGQRRPVLYRSLLWLAVMAVSLAPRAGCQQQVIEDGTEPSHALLSWGSFSYQTWVPVDSWSIRNDQGKAAIRFTAFDNRVTEIHIMSFDVDDIAEDWNLDPNYEEGDDNWGCPKQGGITDDQGDTLYPDTGWVVINVGGGTVECPR